MLDLLEILIGGLLQGGVYAAVGVGFSLVYRVTGVVNLSQGSFCVLGAMAMYYFQVVFGWPIAAAIVAAVLSVTVFALIVGLTSFLPAISRLPTSSMLVLTAGLMTFCEGVALIIWGNQPYALPPFSGEAPLVVGPVRLPTQGLWLAGGASVCILGLWWLVNRTRTGQAFLAAAENAVAARLMGVDVERMMLAAFALAAALGALTGVLLAPISSIQFDSGRALSTYGFIAVAIGGIGTFTGAIVGGILLGIAGQLAAFYVSSLFASSLSLVLLLGILVWRPAGLFASGLSRRTDVRVDSQIHRGLVRYSGRVALLFGAVLLVLLAVVPLLPLSPGVMSSATITMIVFLAVLGLDVLMGYAGQVSLGQAAFMAIGGYAAAILTMSFDQAPWLAVVEAMAISVACGVFLTLITSRLRGHYLALATLTFGLLIDSLTVGLIDVTGGPSGLVGVPSLSFGSFEIDTSAKMYWLALGFAAFAILLLEIGMRAGFGRALRTVRSDQLAAAALGVNVSTVKLQAMCVASALGSLSGSLYAFQFHFLSPEMVATPRSFELIAMLVFGGEGTLVGGLIGAFALTFLPTLLQSLASYKTMVSGALLVGTFLLLPEGVFGRFVIDMRKWFSGADRLARESRR